MQAKNEYYDFDFHPGFWDWLIQANKDKKVYSIIPILEEIEEGLDSCPLKIWSKTNKDAFFLPLDELTMTHMATVALHVQNANYGSSFKNRFMAKADPFLVAYAMANKHTVVSHEVHKPTNMQVKIPTVCAALNVPCVRTFQMLKAEHASFISSV